jgi:hypothetical protein
MSEESGTVLDENASTTDSSPVENSTLSNEEQLKGYALFLEKLKDPSAQPLVERVKQFVTRFPLTLKRDDASARLHEFISRIEEEVPKVNVFFDSGDDEYANAKEGFEKLILKPLHHHFFTIDPNDKVLDDQLAAKIERISPFINLQRHLHGPQELIDDGILELAIDEFRRIDSYRAPRDKLQCVLNGFRVIRHALDQLIGPSKWGADQLLPVCIYTIIRSCPKSLNSNVNFIASFRHPSRLAGEEQYLLMQLNIAIKDIVEIEEVLLKEPSELTVEELSRMWKRMKRLDPESVQDPTRWTVGDITTFVDAYRLAVDKSKNI